MNYDTLNSGLANDDIRAISQDLKGDIWIGFGNNGGVSEVDDSLQWTNYNINNSGLANDTVYAIIQDSNYTWFGTRKGVLGFNDTSWVKYDASDSLVNNIVYSITTDFYGNKWFGTKGGISKFDGATWTNYNYSNGLANNEVRSICVDALNNKWFASFGGGLSKFDNSIWTTYNRQNTGNGLVNDTLYALLEDASGAIWIGTKNGVSKFNNVSSVAATPPVICPGEMAMIGTSGGVLGYGAGWIWSSGSCGNTPAGTGISIIQSPSATTVYYVRAAGQCNTTICLSVYLTVSSPSVPPLSATASPANICSGNPVTMSLNGGSLSLFASWYWYLGSCGGTFTASGISPVIFPSISGTYYVRAEGGCNVTSCVSLTVIVVNPAVPLAVIANPTLINATQSSVISIYGTQSSGGSWEWYQNGCGSMPAIGTGDSIIVSPLVSTTYFTREEIGLCSSACKSVSVQVNLNSQCR